MSISVGILFDGEDSRIHEAIDSAKDFPEIVVLSPRPEDWGPNVKVVLYDWEDSFARARNRLQREASQDWVLHLDSDEKLLFSFRECRREIIGKDYGVFNIKINLGGQTILKPRLVKKNAEWIRRANEIPLHQKGQYSLSFLQIDHQELEPSEILRKHNYNFSLMLEEYEEVGDPELLFLCAIEKSFVDPASAKIYASKYINTFHSIRTPKMRTQYLLMKYLISSIDMEYYGDYKEARTKLRELVAEGPEFCEFWCKLGDVYFRSDSLEIAREMFSNALAFSRHIDPRGRIWADLTKYDFYPRERLSTIEQITKIREENPKVNLEFE